jgi:hypothetical protein
LQIHVAEQLLDVGLPSDFTIASAMLMHGGIGKMTVHGLHADRAKAASIAGKPVKSLEVRKFW